MSFEGNWIIEVLKTMRLFWWFYENLFSKIKFRLIMFIFDDVIDFDLWKSEKFVE